MFKTVHSLIAKDASVSVDGGAVPGDTTQRASIVATVTGATALTGVLTLQASNQNGLPGTVVPEPPADSWADIDTADITSVTGADSVGVAVTGLAYHFLRATWTATSGTGTVDVWMQCVG